PDDAGALLVVKTTHGSKYASDLKRLRSVIATKPNIRLIDEIWSAEDIAGLIAAANVYISLHRSEGFGLTIAEAILRSVPVVTTNWSGNTDFCCPKSIWLIGYKLVLAQSTDSVATFRDGVWAEPDVQQAASALAEIFRDGARARQQAEAARTYADR